MQHFQLERDLRISDRFQFKQVLARLSSDIMQNMVARRRRWAGIVLVVVLLVAASIGISAIRRPILRAAGWALVVSERVEPADVIVVAIDSHGAGVLEAADLFHSGVAPRVAVFRDISDIMVDREFIRRGISHEDAAARAVRQLTALGVNSIDYIPGPVAGTEDEGPVLANWCDQSRFRSVVVVSPPDHSRRLRRVLHRSMKGHQTRFTVHPARYSAFDPNRWWETRGGTRTEVEELEKLFLDVVRHPIS